MQCYYWQLFNSPVTRSCNGQEILPDDYGHIEAESLEAAQQMATAEIMPVGLKRHEYGWQFIEKTKYHAKVDGNHSFLMKYFGDNDRLQPRWCSLLPPEHLIEVRIIGYHDLDRKEQAFNEVEGRYRRITPACVERVINRGLKLVEGIGKIYCHSKGSAVPIADGINKQPTAHHQVIVIGVRREGHGMYLFDVVMDTQPYTKEAHNATVQQSDTETTHKSHR